MPIDDYEDLQPFSVADVASGETKLLCNALCAQLWPLTGNRATGTALVKATGADVIIPPNTYAFPVVQREAEEQKILKVDFNPATRKHHQTGGEWTVTSAGTLVTFKSNVGGLKMNIPAGSMLRFSPPIPGIDFDVEVQAPGFTGGTNGLVLDVVQYDDIDSPDKARAMLQGKIGNFPAIALAWIKSTPIEGRTAGLAQGATRKGRDVRVYFENLILYIVSNNSSSGELRRSIAMNLKDAVIDLLSDYKRNFDGEYLTSMGTGVEIQDSNRLPKIEQATTIAMTLRTIAVRHKGQFAKYSPWIRTLYRSYRAAEMAEEEGQDPVHAQDLELSAPLDLMPR